MYGDFAQIDTSITIPYMPTIKSVVVKDDERKTLNRLASVIDEQTGFPTNLLGSLQSEKTPPEVRDGLRRLIGTQYPDNRQDTSGLDDNHILGLTPDYHESAGHYQETVISEISREKSNVEQRKLRKKLEKESRQNNN